MTTCVIGKAYFCFLFSAVFGHPFTRSIELTANILFCICTCTCRFMHVCVDRCVLMKKKMVGTGICLTGAGVNS